MQSCFALNYQFSSIGKQFTHVLPMQKRVLKKHDGIDKCSLSKIPKHRHKHQGPERFVVAPALGPEWRLRIQVPCPQQHFPFKPSKN